MYSFKGLYWKIVRSKMYDLSFYPKMLVKKCKLNPKHVGEGYNKIKRASSKVENKQKMKSMNHKSVLLKIL